MKVIYIDDELIALQAMTRVLNGFSYITSYEMFNNPFDAVRYVKSNKIDVALIDIQMPGINGIELAKLLRLEDENIQIIFVTGNDEYALDAYKIDAIGYVLKPYSNEEINKELQKVQKFISGNERKRVRIQTFGNFDIFVDGKIVVFNWPKTKEFLAVLVDRKGSFVSTNELLAFLFEDQEITESIRSYVRTLKSNLKNILSNLGIDDIVMFSKNGCALRCEKVDCDYYDYLDNNRDAIKLFRGEYMSNYSWAEDTLMKLLQD